MNNFMLSLTPPQRRSLAGLSKLQREARIQFYLQQNGYTKPRINPVINYRANTRTRTTLLPPRTLNSNLSPLQNNTYRQRVVSQPSASGSIIERQNTGEQTTFRGTNYVFDVPSSTSFSSYSWNIHPSNIPFLKEQSELFARYKFISLQYRVVTTAPTNISGQHWSGYQTRAHELKPTGLDEAQYLQSFHVAPIWKTDDQFHRVDPSVLTDRWFSTAIFGENIDKDLSPGFIHFGTSSMASNQPMVNVGMLEVSYTIQLRDRRLPKGTQSDHSQQSIIFLKQLLSYHPSRTPHDQAVQMRLKAMIHMEENAEESSQHNDAIIELVNAVNTHCSQQPKHHYEQVQLVLDELKSLHSGAVEVI